jgi:putative two-component system response regulator
MEETEVEEKPLILTVDDDSVMNVHVMSSLNAYYKVVTLNSGRAALKFLSENKVDLVILDINMPEVSGFEVFAEMQKMPEMKDIPVIFLTGVEKEDIVSQIIKSGANDYILKPIAPAEILLHVKNQLEMSRKRKVITLKEPESGKKIRVNAVR